MRRVPWTRQPPYPVGIDWSNPITRNLVFAFEGANGQRCPISRLSAPLSSGNTRDIGRYGIQQKFSGSQAGGSNNFGALKAISGATQATWDVLFYLDNVSQSAKVFQQWNNNNQNWLIDTSGTGLLWVALDDDSGQRRRWDATNTFPTAGWYRLILVWAGGSSKRARINKVDITASLTEVNNTGTVHGNNLDPLSIGVASDSPLAGKVVFARMWTRALSVAEVVSLEDLPWQIFEPYTVFGMSPTYVTAQTLTQSSSYSNTNTFYTHTLAATVSLAQSARFDNSNGLAYSHTLTPGVRALTQSSRFDNANTLNYTHTLTPGVRALTQSARFDNSNSLAYTHTLAAAITLAQSSRYDNTNSLAYAHSLSASITLSQSSRFDNSNSLSYTHSISQVGGAQSLTQSARHDNDSTFYTHSLAAGAVGLTQSARFDNTNGLAYAHTLAASISLPQGARFDNANGLSYAHSLSASITLAQSARFDNSNGLAYQHSISQAGGTQSLEQSARYDNTNSLTYQHTVSAGTVTLDQSARFDNAAQFFAHTVVQAADQFIFPAYYENANGFYQHLIGDGSVEIASGGAFHPPRIDDPRKRRRRDDETLLVIGAI